MTTKTEPHGSPATEPHGSPAPAPQGATTPPVEPPHGGTAAPQGAAEQPPTLPDPAEDWQALARKWEKRAKDNTAALDALKKQMQGLLTPEQVQDQAQAAASAAEQATRASHEALRLRVALRKGLPESLADRLIGDDEAALAKDADTLLAMVPAQPPPPPPSRVPDAGAGTGRTAPQKRDPNELLRIAAGVMSDTP